MEFQSGNNLYYVFAFYPIYFIVAFILTLLFDEIEGKLTIEWFLNLVVRLI